MSNISQKQLDDFRNSVSLLNTYLDIYENKGNALMFLPMAVELRKLLCEKQGDPLISLAIPGVRLYEFHSNDLFTTNKNLLVGLENFMPGSLKFSTSGLMTLSLSFSRSHKQMELESWLNQIFFKEGITIRDFIKSVADKQAAHADKNYNDVLLHCKNWTFNDLGCEILGVYALSRFIYDFISIEHKGLLS